jgi:hypothetical protein
MGSGAEAVHEMVEWLNEREKGRRRQGPAVSPVRQRGVPEGAAGDRQPDRGAGPHQGAGRTGEPLYLDVLSTCRGAGREPHAPQRGAGHRRRPLRPVLQGVQRPMVKAVFDNLAADEPKNHFTVGYRRRRQPHFAARGRRLRHRTATTSSAASSSVSVPTARSAPTRTPSRSSARRPTTSPRATSCTTRRRPARSPSRTCGSARSPSARPT